MKDIELKIGVRAAAAVRQILFDHQKGYTTNVDSVPPRILEIREVITDIDDAIEKTMK